MACPALPTCGLAVAEAERVLPEVIAELEAELERLGVADAALTVRMTGCPNGCARPYTADLAFVGRSLHKYGVFVGGSMLGTRLGTLYADLVPRDRLVATVRPLFERHRDERLRDERVGGLCHRVGLRAVRGARPLGPWRLNPVSVTWAEAEREGVLLNAVDDLDHCSFIAPAIHREGDVTVAVSTSGKSPALAARLRQRVAQLVGPTEARLCALLGELRPELAARVPDTRARTTLWYRIVDSDVIDFVRRGDMEGARERIDELVTQPPDIPRLKPGPGTTLPLRAVPDRAHSSEGEYGTGVVDLVGAGPGEPGLITARGLEILRSADVLVYDRLVAPALVAEAPPAAERVFVGKPPHGGGVDRAQDEINELLVDRAQRGLTVVRLKGGDPFVFGRGAEECEALHAAGVSFRVVPGVTSAIAAPAAAGIPVTHRRLASAFAVVTGHECAGASSLDWEALARVPTLVVLMGLSALPEVTAPP